MITSNDFVWNASELEHFQGYRRYVGTQELQLHYTFRGEMHVSCVA